jgi:hypothetical protein
MVAVAVLCTAVFVCLVLFNVCPALTAAST